MFSRLKGRDFDEATLDEVSSGVLQAVLDDPELKDLAAAVVAFKQFREMPHE